MSSIKQRIAEVNNRIQEIMVRKKLLDIEKRSIQQECPHDDVYVSGDLGGYEFYVCSDCEKEHCHPSEIGLEKWKGWSES